jgi:hypothetical protein
MVNITLDDGVAAALSAKAEARGLTVQAYLEAIVSAEPHRPRISPEELDRLLEEEATAGPSPSGTFSRADLYCDHD